MTVTRQSNLFASEDWKVAYKSFSQVNFQAYDFDSIRGTLVEYVRTNYPENFNDYIESSEFIAIIELLAFLSQSLAFRMDVNSRENFLETAERRDSVFKLARMLGYNPKRNAAASGVLKVQGVRTTESLQDSLGNSLANRLVNWNDANNTQSYEQFLIIMNAAMSRTNRFTSPIKSGLVGGIETELYQLNTPRDASIAYRSTISTSGTNRIINVVNANFEDNGFFFERHPNPQNLFNVIYRNDGKGAASENTGFFTLFRQGDLTFTDFDFTTPVQSRIQDVNIANINESDVYLQEVDSTGVVVQRWEKIPNTVGQTLNYNNVQLGTRNLYAVETLGQDGIRLRFPDGNFGNIPRGIFRLWYRTSDPERYTIQPSDAQNINVAIPYVNERGERHTVTLTCDLQQRVSNSLPAENLESIKQRAPQVYYTQNRMVSAQDYNVFPQSQSGNITKIKATNKTHAGHSRYIDINDPTGTFNNVDTFADDAYLYIDYRSSTEQITVNNNTTPLEVVSSIIPNRLKQFPINNFVYYRVRNVLTDPAQNGTVDRFRFTEGDNVVWNVLPVRSTGKTGFFTEQFTVNSQTNVLVNTLPRTRMLKENTMIKFVNPANIADFKWVRVVAVSNNGALASSVNTGTGPWTLSEEVNANWRVEEVIVSMRKLFTSSEATSIQNAISDRQTFALGYDLVLDSWYIIPNSELTTDSKTGDFAINPDGRGPYSWLILMRYEPLDQFSFRYNITIRGADYVVQSISDVKFYDVDNNRVTDSTSRSNRDVITFSTVNTQPSATELYEWRGAEWFNRTTGTTHQPVGVRAMLPLKTRDTSWEDVDVSWISNFGIFKPEGGSTLSAYVTNDRYVNDTIVPLNTFNLVGGIVSESNVVIQDNTGTITSLPDTITIPLDNATFGQKIVDDSATPFITYRQVPDNGTTGSEVIFFAELGSDPISYGPDGLAPDPNTIGRLYLTAWDAGTQTGTLEYRNVQSNDFHFSEDGTGRVSQDKLNVLYRINKEKLTEPVKWQIFDSFKEDDGYTDPRKVKVVPLDTDSDLVPDRPRQFTDYVGPTDLVLFEFYTDFDGYRYDRPFSGRILDIRTDDDIAIDDNADTIQPQSRSKTVKLSTLDWVLVKDYAIAELFEDKSNARGLVIYVADEDTTYRVVPSSTDTTQSVLVESTDFFVRQGRGKTQSVDSLDPEDGTIRWQHYAPNDVRIDPSISNIVEMVLLTTSYYNDVRRWQTRQTGEFPLEPTSSELATEFAGLNTYKSASDSLVYRSAKFKLLFGNQADDTYRARFRVVKLSDNLSDNELKTRIITAINEYFAVENWEFGETFYFTELSSYIHQSLGSAVGSIVILPRNLTGTFGELFQVKAEPNELFISTATVNDIELVSRLDNQTLRTDR